MAVPKDDACYGCYFTKYENTNNIAKCNIKRTGFQLKCPCSNCIISIMCKTPCEDLTTLLKQINENRRSTFLGRVIP
jgi:hypothetical protein